MACTLTSTLPTRARAAPRLTQRTRCAPLRCVATNDSGKLDVTYRPAKDLADLRASAAVRAQAFHVYDKSRSEYAQRTHRKMKLDAEWAALQRKMTDSEPGYETTKVTMLMATIPMPEEEELVERLQAGNLDPSCKLPANEDENVPVTMCLGTLDINKCDIFVSEELQPKQRSSGDDGRAYISNVAVAEGARRQGIAKHMVEKTEEWCLENSIKQLYVHVVPSNEAAVNLYTQKCGFKKESEETAAFGYIRDRERRLLLRKDLVVDSAETRTV